ncbi:MAG: thioredoxin family protein [Pseudomonadota bacterium]
MSKLLTGSIRQMTRFLAAFALSALIAHATALAGEFRLLMLDQEACEWCEQWEEDIGGAYHLTQEGKIAPLTRASIHEPLPDGIALERRAGFTPTFVLLEDGTEVGRLEGYAGADFFYPMLDRLLRDAGALAE